MLTVLLEIGKRLILNTFFLKINEDLRTFFILPESSQSHFQLFTRIFSQACVKQENHQVAFTDVRIVAVLQATVVQRTAEILPSTVVKLNILFPVQLVLVRKIHIKHRFVLIQLSRRCNKNLYQLTSHFSNYFL